VTVRVLSQDQWSRLSRAGFPPIPNLRDENIALVVVEDDEGNVVACMSVLRATHYEGVWIDPQHRNAGVTRGLLRQAAQVARDWGSEWVFVGRGSSDGNMAEVLEKLGAVELPIQPYLLSVEDK
jgi:GNAT superfamily N-acetyltransferase